METYKFPLVLRTREIIDVFITLGENIHGIHILITPLYAVSILWLHMWLLCGDVARTELFLRTPCKSIQKYIHLTKSPSELEIRLSSKWQMSWWSSILFSRSSYEVRGFQ